MYRLFLVALLAAACQQPRPSDPLPEIPKPEYATATLSGRVLDGNNLPVEGVIVTVSETDSSYTTAADGLYVLRVPASTTFTVRTNKPLYAGTTVSPLWLEPDRVVSGLDILAIPSSSVGAYNANAGFDEERGVIAIHVVSLSGRCDASNATVSILNPETLQPMPGAKSLYVKTGTSQPDRNVTAMQNGSRPNAWLVGVPEGQNYPVRFEKTGCAPLQFPVVHQNLTYQPGLRVALHGVAQVPVFVE